MAVAMAGALVWTMTSRTTPSTPTASAANETAPHVAPPAQTPAVAEQIALTLRATPPEARFTIDDGPALENPTRVRFPRDGQAHQIKAAAPGFADRVKTITFVEDVVVDVSLERLPEDKKSGPTPPRGPVTTPAKAPPAQTGKPKRVIDTEPPWP
jgi:hypothetical protein